METKNIFFTNVPLVDEAKIYGKELKVVKERDYLGKIIKKDDGDTMTTISDQIRSRSILF